MLISFLGGYVKHRTILQKAKRKQKGRKGKKSLIPGTPREWSWEVRRQVRIPFLEEKHGFSFRERVLSWACISKWPESAFLGSFHSGRGLWQHLYPCWRSWKCGWGLQLIGFSSERNNGVSSFCIQGRGGGLVWYNWHLWKDNYTVTLLKMSQETVFYGYCTKICIAQVQLISYIQLKQWGNVRNIIKTFSDGWYSDKKHINHLQSLGFFEYF